MNKHSVYSIVLYEKTGKSYRFTIPYTGGSLVVDTEEIKKKFEKILGKELFLESPSEREFLEFINKKLR